MIVNLQKTSKDAKASIVIRAKIDAVMRCVMKELGVPIPVRVIYFKKMSGLVSLPKWQSNSNAKNRFATTLLCVIRG